MSGRDARKRALAGRIFWASVEVRVRHGTRPQKAARPLVTLQPSYTIRPDIRAD